jgi:hypothetical protein
VINWRIAPSRARVSRKATIYTLCWRAGE